MLRVCGGWARVISLSGNDPGTKRKVNDETHLEEVSPLSQCSPFPRIGWLALVPKNAGLSRCEGSWVSDQAVGYGRG